MFHFDRVFDGASLQEDLYAVAARPVVHGLFEGINGTVFAYGQTSSGKTFTMEGPEKPDASTCGIIPRVVDDVFATIQSSDPLIEFRLLISMVEIYMERIRDLLDPEKDNL